MEPTTVTKPRCICKPCVFSRRLTCVVVAPVLLLAFALTAAVSGLCLMFGATWRTVTALWDEAARDRR